MKLAEFRCSPEEVQELATKYANPTTKFDRHMASTIESMEEALKRVDSGALVVNIQETLRRGGSVSGGFPALGWAPARYHGAPWQVKLNADGSVIFEGRTKMQRLFTAREPIRFPAESFRSAGWMPRGTASVAWTTIPVIPPQYREFIAHDSLYIWEARWNIEVPNLDPAILKPIGKGLAEVVAQWDLTPLEAEALRYL